MAKAPAFVPRELDLFATPAPITQEEPREPPQTRKAQVAAILSILEHLPDGHCLSRDEIITRYGTYPDGSPRLSVNAACGRLNSLVNTLQQVEEVEFGAMSNYGNKATGYKLRRGVR